MEREVVEAEEARDQRSVRRAVTYTHSPPPVAPVLIAPIEMYWKRLGKRFAVALGLGARETMCSAIWHNLWSDHLISLFTIRSFVRVQIVP